MEYIDAIHEVGFEVCDHSAVVNLLVQRGWERIDAQIMTLSFPIISKLGEIREIWIFGDDDRLIRKELAKNNEFYKKIISESQGVMEVSPTVSLYGPKMRNCHKISTDIWVGGSNGP